MGCVMIEQCNFKTAGTLPKCAIAQDMCQYFKNCVLEDNCVLYQAYKSASAGNTAVCPVCNGRGTLPYGFYPGEPKDATGAGQTTQCRSCIGRGIVVGGFK